LTAYVADTLGELGLFYRLADAIVLGGSLQPGLRGHNPLEPARLGKAVVAGQHISSFADTYAELKARQGVLIAHGSAELATGLMALLAEPDLARAMGANARGLCLGEQDAFDAAWTRLTALLTGP
jgi:3-deoxy-D-manno-octulosonic-acid transferase